jgi:ectoine hydroxylase-related dioxygenase (phytanoyl-CoA dioxygenase family)
VVRPDLEAGDLLIWNGLLAHGVAPNTSADGVRSVQYLSMMPALPTHHELVRSRVDSWRERTVPEWDSTLIGAIPPESQRYEAAELTDLGKKLLGLEPWSDR